MTDDLRQKAEKTSDLPLIEKTFQLFYKKHHRNLANTYIFACQHILRPREKVLPLFVKYGIPMSNIFVLGKAYSTNETVLRDLRAAGFQVINKPFIKTKSFDEQHIANCHKLYLRFKKVVPAGSRVIILDDGGALLAQFNKNFRNINKDVEVLGIEQTSSGFRQLSNQQLEFPVINVARSSIKLEQESPFIADICIEKLAKYLDSKKMKEARYVIIGMGPIGQAIHSKLRTMGKEVLGMDIDFSQSSILKKIKSQKANVVIGATGSQALNQLGIEALKALDYPIYLVSVSSSDREFPVAKYRDNHGTDTLSDVVYGNLTFVSGGFPINFSSSKYKNGVRRIEKIICLLMGSAFYLSSIKDANLPKGFIDVPQKITECVELDRDANQ